MTTPTNPIEPFTPFLPAVSVVPEEEDRRRTYLTDKFSSYADVINDKKIGMYVQNAENFNGNKFFYDTTKKTRNGYQVLCRIPSFIPMTITLTSTPKFPLTDVNPQFVISETWGSASKPCTAVGAGDGDYFSFFNQGDARIQYTLSDTQIVITTNGTTAAYQGFIFIEFIRDGI